MKALVAIPTLGLALIFQSAIISRITMLSGCADLVLLVLAAWGLRSGSRHVWIWAVIAGLMVGYVSHQPLLIPVAAYLLVMFLARLMQHHIWQAPLLGMYLLTFAGTLITMSATYLTLWFGDVQLPLGETFLQIVLPALLLNLLLAIPVHPLIRDLSAWLHPAEIVEA